MRSQDVLHSAYMPHFRAQMNCVPGMITQFAFTPSMTTDDMRMNDEVIEKVEYINQIRTEKNIELLAKGVLERTGIVLAAGQIIVAYTSVANISAVVMGIETSTA